MYQKDKEFTVSKMPINIPISVISSMGNLVSDVIGYLNTREIEKTKRVEIVKNAEEKIQKIRAIKEIFLSIIEKEYSERIKVYNELFERLDRGIEVGDTKIMELAMMGIIEQVKKNPFENFAEFSKNLKNPNYIEEF